MGSQQSGDGQKGVRCKFGKSSSRLCGVVFSQPFIGYQFGENCVHCLDCANCTAFGYAQQLIETWTIGRLDGLQKNEISGISQREQFSCLFSGYARASVPADSSRSSMGIGLSVCRTIIKAHGGDIRAKNRPEGGASFSFTLELEESNYVE